MEEKATPLILQNILLCFNPCFSKGILLQEAILGAITQEKIFERKEEEKKNGNPESKIMKESSPPIRHFQRRKKFANNYLSEPSQVPEQSPP